MQTVGSILFFFGLISSLIVIVITITGMFKPTKYKKGMFWKSLLAETISFLILSVISAGFIFLGYSLAGW